MCVCVCVRACVRAMAFSLVQGNLPLGPVTAGAEHDFHARTSQANTGNQLLGCTTARNRDIDRENETY